MCSVSGVEWHRMGQKQLLPLVNFFCPKFCIGISTKLLHILQKYKSLTHAHVQTIDNCSEQLCLMTLKIVVFITFFLFIRLEKWYMCVVRVLYCTCVGVLLFCFVYFALLEDRITDNTLFVCNFNVSMFIGSKKKHLGPKSHTENFPY